MPSDLFGKKSTLDFIKLLIAVESKFENGASTSPIWKKGPKHYVIVTLNFFSSFYSYLGISN